MMSVKQDFEVVIGDSWSQPFRRLVGPDKNSLVQVDMTGCTGVMTVFGSDPLVPMFSLTTANGGLTLNGATGYSIIKLTSAQTGSVTKTKPRAYEIKVTDTLGDEKTVLSGHLKFVKRGG